jgi:hypothetical protein
MGKIKDRIAEHLAGDERSLDWLVDLIDDDLDGYLATEYPEHSFEAWPRAGGWEIRADWNPNNWSRYLRQSEGWTQDLVDQLERILNELPE